jgi:hypothetical protein
MSRLGSFLVGALMLLAMPAAFAQAPDVSGTVQAPPYVLPGETTTAPQQPPALLSIGGLPVRVWAPVPPPYDSNWNRNFNADPLGVGMDSLPWASE